MHKTKILTPFYERDGVTIYCGECSDVMSHFEPQSFDLTVTSPPYDNLRDYQGYVFDFDAIAAQLWRVTNVGGVVVWVVGDQTKNGSESGTSFRQSLAFMELGFRLHDTMIYHRSCSPLTHNRYEQHFEYMFVLSSGPARTFNPILTPRKFPDNRKTKQMRREKDNTVDIGFVGNTPNVRKGNVWKIKAGGGHTTKDKGAFRHPAIFPEALARDHIISWSNPGDLVLDPMMGSGTTLKMAQQEGRRAVGIEISENYCKIAVERLRQRSIFQVIEMPEQSNLEQTKMEM